MEQVDKNYEAAQGVYQAKRKSLLEQIENQSQQSGESFIEKLQDKFSDNMKQTIVSPDSKRSVKYETIIKHIYRAAELKGRSIIEDVGGNLDELKEEIQKIKQSTEGDIETEKKLIDKEIDKIVSEYATKMDINQIFNKYLPQILSGENQKLSVAQVLAYCKSIFKREIQKQLSMEKIDSVIKKRPAIILGYIREDMLSDAAIKAIDECKIENASAMTVGSEQSMIDVLIPITGGAAKASDDKELLGSILKKLDGIKSSTFVVGESKFNTDEFLGIQVKPWNLYKKTTKWNPMSLGSRTELLNDYAKSLSGETPDDVTSWHKGVIYLSENLTKMLGENTVMYVTGNNIIWTDNLLSDLVNKYNKYFAFGVNSKNQLTSHIVLADHYA
jgi:hypothetical protein